AGFRLPDGTQPEDPVGELDQMRGDVGFLATNAEDQATCPARVHGDRAVTQEVADKFSKLLGRCLGKTNGCRVGVKPERERGESNALDRQIRLLLKSYPIADFDVFDSLPDVVSFFADDTESMLEGGAHRVTMASTDAPYRHHSVDIELVGVSGPLVCRHAERGFVGLPRVG